MAKHFFSRGIAILLSALLLSTFFAPAPAAASIPVVQLEPTNNYDLALQQLGDLAVKGRAPKTGYERSNFGREVSAYDYDRNGCVTRDDILQRDLFDVQIRVGSSGCVVIYGTLFDPYTAETIQFIRTGQPGGNSNAVQIDHVVALSDAWQKGAQQWGEDKRHQFMHDPLNLLAVKGAANASKGDGDAATWLPPNKSFRCDYVSLQVAVKHKYAIWITQAEKSAINNLLVGCGARGTTFTGPFIDIPDDHQFIVEINWMYETGVSTGYTTADGPEYRPRNQLSRQAMAAFLFRQYGAEDYIAPETSPFSDVDESHQFFREISWMYDSDLSTGYETFEGIEYRPGGKLSRQAMAAFMYRILSDGYIPAAGQFIDVDENHQFSTEINWMKDAGLSNGYTGSDGPEYRPSNRLSREAMAPFLYRSTQ